MLWLTSFWNQTNDLFAQFAKQFSRSPGRLRADTDSANHVWNHFSGKQVCDAQWMDIRFRKTNRFVTSAVKGKYSIYDAGASTMIKTVIGWASFETIRLMKPAVNMVTRNAQPVVKRWNEGNLKNMH